MCCVNGRPCGLVRDEHVNAEDVGAVAVDAAGVDWAVPSGYSGGTASADPEDEMDGAAADDDDDDDDDDAPTSAVTQSATAAMMREARGLVRGVVTVGPFIHTLILPDSSLT